MAENIKWIGFEMGNECGFNEAHVRSHFGRDCILSSHLKLGRDALRVILTVDAEQEFDALSAASTKLWDYLETDEQTTVRKAFSAADEAEAYYSSFDMNDREVDLTESYRQLTELRDQLKGLDTSGA